MHIDPIPGMASFHRGREDSNFSKVLEMSSESACLYSEGGKTGSTLPPDLRAIIAAWETLPPAVRAGIIAMVEASKR